MFKRVVLPVMIILLAIAGFILLKTTKPVAEVIEKTESVWRVQTVPVIVSSYAPERIIYGRIETPKQTTLTAGVNADVISVNKYEGQHVTKGEVVIQLDPVDEQLVLQQRQADIAELNALIEVEQNVNQRDKSLLKNQQELLKLSEAAVERATRLGKSKLASQVTLDDALAAQQQQLITVTNLQHAIKEYPARLAQLQARLERAQSLLNQSERTINRTVIRSPFSGRISELSVSEGERVRLGDNLITIYDLQQLELRAQIPNLIVKQLNAMIASGTPIKAHAIINGEPAEFELSRLSGEVQTESGGIEALFSLIGEKTFALGTFVELTLQLARHDNVISLPYNALYGLDRVYKIIDQHLIATPVTIIGERIFSNGERHILVQSDQLTERDNVITTQLPNATSGLKVETVNE